MVITAKEEEHTNTQQSWKEVSIKDVCESIIDCINKTAPAVDYETPYKMIRTNNVRNGDIDLSDVKYVTKEVFEIWTRRITPKKGDIILTREAPLGEVCMIKTDDHIFLGQRLMQYRANPCYLDNRFLLYAFQEHTLQEQIRLLGSGATVEHMRVSDAEKLMLRLPPLPEQQAIATALSDVDALITSLGQLIAKKRDIKQATMQQLLTGKMRLPGFSKELKPAYKQTDAGMIPVEWSPYKFAQIAAVRKKKIDPKRSGIYSFCIELEHIGQGSGRLISYSTTTEESSLKAQFNTGDILFGRLRPYLRKYWLADREGVCSTEIWPLVPNEDVITQQYLFQLVQTNQFIEATSSAYGTRMPRADWNVIKNYVVSLPSLDEQYAIAAVLSDMDAEITALEQKRDKTRALKQAMMQELLTGKTRLL